MAGLYKPHLIPTLEALIRCSSFINRHSISSELNYSSDPSRPRLYTSSNMKFSSTLILATTTTLFGGALAAPAPVPVQLLNTRQSSSTRNELSGACKDVTVIYARGTTESGNVGSIAGPPFFTALAAEIGSSRLAVQGVDYPGKILISRF